MIKPTSADLVQFTRFKDNVYQAALEVLRASDTEYVESFSRDPGGTTNKKPLKGLPKRWQEIMESLVSYEFAMEDVKLSLRFLSRECPLPDTVCTPGQWVNFHFESWMNATYSWQQKLQLLVKRLCRRLNVTHKLDPQRSMGLEERLLGLWTTFDVKRGEYIHKTGAISAISEDPGWEAALVLGMDVACYPYMRNHEYAAGRQENWHRLLFAATTQQLANLEGFFESLNRTLFSIDQT